MENLPDKLASDFFVSDTNPKLLKHVLDGVEESIKIIDRDFNVVFANSKGEKAAGRPIQQILGNKCFKEFYKNEEECSFCITQRVFDTGVGASTTFVKKTKGKEKVIEINVYPLRNDKGTVEYALELLRDVTDLKAELTRNLHYGNIISKDPCMKDVFRFIDSVSDTDSTVLIKGETGTGKELVARAIHARSKRSNRKFVPINCGAMVDTLLESELFGHERGAFTGAEKRHIGKFELAHDGTLFLDEIGDISEAMQIKILRVLQEGELSRVGSNDVINVDVRVVAATNKDLLESIKQKKFREDLYYRVNVFPIYLPPLRERREDITLLARNILEIYNRQMGKNIRDFGQRAINQMMRYSWPGNIRELKNLVERAVIMNSNGIIDEIDIPLETVREKESVNLTLKECVSIVERDYLLKILKMYNGNITDSSDHSGVDTRTMYRKMRQYNLTKELFKGTR